MSARNRNRRLAHARAKGVQSVKFSRIVSCNPYHKNLRLTVAFEDGRAAALGVQALRDRPATAFEVEQVKGARLARELRRAKRP